MRPRARQVGATQRWRRPFCHNAYSEGGLNCVGACPVWPLRPSNQPPVQVPRFQAMDRGKDFLAGWPGVGSGTY
eukprot:9951701-Lingulodinium_polyedra.AAC.1